MNHSHFWSYYKNKVALFQSILAKRFENIPAERKKIITLFFRQEICPRSIAALERMIRHDTKEIRIDFLKFIGHSIKDHSRTIEGQTRIIMLFSPDEPIIHTIAINPDPQIRRLKKIIAHEFSDKYAIIFELLARGFNNREIAKKINGNTRIIGNIIFEITDYLRKIA